MAVGLDVAADKRNDPKADNPAVTSATLLAEIERLATQLLREVNAARAAAAAKSYLPGERSGLWHAVRLGR